MAWGLQPVSWEEEFYLPLFSPKFDFSTIVTEHEAFSAGLKQLGAYLVSCLASGAKYGYDKIAPEHEQQFFKAGRLLELVDKFAEELALHVSRSLHEISLLLLTLLFVIPARSGNLLHPTRRTALVWTDGS